MQHASSQCDHKLTRNSYVVRLRLTVPQGQSCTYSFVTPISCKLNVTARRVCGILQTVQQLQSVDVCNNDEQRSRPTASHAVTSSNNRGVGIVARDDTIETWAWPRSHWPRSSPTVQRWTVHSMTRIATQYAHSTVSRYTPPATCCHCNWPVTR